VENELRAGDLVAPCDAPGEGETRKISAASANLRAGGDRRWQSL
jgi:hypothetical protein